MDPRRGRGTRGIRDATGATGNRGRDGGTGCGTARRSAPPRPPTPSTAPDYAEAAVRWALAPVWDRRPVRVADIGAGTGKLTAMLVRLGAEVTAVEPDPQMLAELRRAMPAVRSVPGSAEADPAARRQRGRRPGRPGHALVRHGPRDARDRPRAHARRGARRAVERGRRPGGLGRRTGRDQQAQVQRHADAMARRRGPVPAGPADRGGLGPVPREPRKPSSGTGRRAPPIPCWPPSGRTLICW